MTVESLFERELQRRGVVFRLDPDTGRHELELKGSHSLVSLENLRRDFDSDGDSTRVARFVDNILVGSQCSDLEYSAEGLYWSLEPSDYEIKADYCVSISAQADRVLVHLSPDAGLITWVNSVILDRLGMTLEEAGARAMANLRKVMSEASIEFSEIDGVRLGYIGTSLPFKASLLFAPNLEEVAGQVLGWPLLAVAPDRDFLYLWDAAHTDFVNRVGSVVIEQYSQSSYAISTEVYEISTDGIQAIGAFPNPDR